MANEADGTISRVELGEASGSTEDHRERAASGGWGWRANCGSPFAARRQLIVAAPSDCSVTTLPESLDPSGAYDTAAWTVLHLLGDGLVATEPVGGTSRGLVPDLSTSIPVPTDGGITYTFELREGIRYSNGEIVEPIDFRAGDRASLPSGTVRSFPLSGARRRSGPATTSLERVISPKASRSTALKEGRSRSTWSIPTPRFLYKLSIPLSYPVPASRPRRGAGESGCSRYRSLHRGCSHDRRWTRAGSKPLLPSLVVGGPA